jgi:Cft2 family RNA processing exonuclease
MKLSFLGAARTVTGSFFLVDTENSRFAVDCGMFQGPRALQERNFNDFPIEPESIDFLILTHAHIDHIGLVPKLCLYVHVGFPDILENAFLLRHNPAWPCLPEYQCYRLFPERLNS